MLDIENSFEFARTHAPFTKNGLLHYVNYYGGIPEMNGWGPAAVPITWRPMDETFRLTLTIDHLKRGRSAAYFIWTDENDASYPMFMKEMVAMLKVATMVEGKLTGTWKTCKRGTNYGIKLVES